MRGSSDWSSTSLSSLEAITIGNVCNWQQSYRKPLPHERVVDLLDLRYVPAKRRTESSPCASAQPPRRTYVRGMVANATEGDEAPVALTSKGGPFKRAQSTEAKHAATTRRSLAKAGLKVSTCLPRRNEECRKRWYFASEVALEAPHLRSFVFLRLAEGLARCFDIFNEF